MLCRGRSRSSVVVRLGVLVLLGGCGNAGGLDAQPDPYPMPGAVTLMSYNVANAGSDAKGSVIAAHIDATAPDFVAAQECAGCDDLLEQLDTRYRATRDRPGGVAILYDSASWMIIDQGSIVLGVNDDGWGERAAVWGRFENTLTRETLYVYSTHWCVTIRDPNDACTVERHLEYANTLLDHIDSREVRNTPVVIGGDLNVFDGFEQAPAVRFLVDDAGWIDVFRVAVPNGDGTTFSGNSWAPPGRIDYVLATPPVDVIDAYVDRESVPLGEGSDHFAVVALLAYAGE